MDVRTKLDAAEVNKTELNGTIAVAAMNKKELERKLDDAKQTIDKYLVTQCYRLKKIKKVIIL